MAIILIKDKKSLIYYACIIYYAYLCCLKRKIKFRQEYLALDYDGNDVYLLLVELEYDIPIRTFIVKVPKPDLRFTIYPFKQN